MLEREFDGLKWVGRVYWNVMETATIKRYGSLVGETAISLAEHAIEQAVDEFGVEAAKEHYYTEGYSVTPVMMWLFPAWLAVISMVVGVQALATVVGVGATVNPVVDVIGAWLIFVSMVGMFVLHIGLMVHARYRRSPYKVRSPVVRER